MSGDQPPTALILVVDDDAAMRSALAEALTSDAHEVLEAHDAASAFDLLQRAERFPELIVLDVDLPDGSGLELLRRIRGLRAAERTRYLVISAGRDHDIPFGVTYVQKPFILAAFLQTVRAELGGVPGPDGGTYEVELAPVVQQILARSPEEIRRQLEEALEELGRNPRPRSATLDGPAQYRLTTRAGWLRYRVDAARRKIVLVDGGLRGN